MVGQYSQFSAAVIDVLSKNKHNVSLLTCEDNLRAPHKSVYEHYYFDYNSNSINDILNSVNPECIIFTGAYDTEFSWKHPQDDSPKYISAVMNIALAAKSLEIPKFIYLSSSEVFEDSSLSPLTEETPANAKSVKGVTIAQGETVCQSFSYGSDMKVVVLRLDNLYKIPTSLKSVTSETEKFALDAFLNGEIKPNEKHIRSHIGIFYAAKAILKVAEAEDIQHTVYNISDGCGIDELKAAKLISDYDGSVFVSESSLKFQDRIVLDPSRFKEEFDFEIADNYENDIVSIYAYIKKHGHRFVDENTKNLSLKEKIKRLMKALYPYAESAVFAVGVGFLNALTQNSVYFKRIDFFLIYVIVFGLIYGKSKAIIATLFSVIVYLAFCLSSETAAIDMSLYIWIAELFIIGMAVGHIKDKNKTSTQDKDDEIDYLSGRLSDVAKINDSNLKIKDILKTQVLDCDNSLSRLYAISRNLNKKSINEILFYSAEMLTELLVAKDIAIYRVTDNRRGQLSVSTKDGKVLGFNCDFENYGLMFKELKNGAVFVNKSQNSDFPVMATALNNGNEIRIIIAVWGLKYTQLTLSTINLLTVLGSIIQDAVNRTDNQPDLLEKSRLSGCKTILTKDAFSELSSIFKLAKTKGFSDASFYNLKTELTDISEIDRLISEVIRTVDIVGIGKTDEVSVILSNDGSDETKKIIGKLSENGFICTEKTDFE